MRIAAAQFEAAVGDPVRNIARMTEFVSAAAAKGADVVVFPEMSDTGYDMPEILKSASNWEDAPMQALRSSAQRHDIAVIAGLSERVGADVYNAVAVIARDGALVARYRKVHLITATPIHEERFLKPGSELVLSSLDAIPIGLLLCYDLRFPEVARALGLGGAQILFMPAAWPLARQSH